MKYPAVPVALLCCLTLINSGCSVFGNKPKGSADKSWSISKLWKKEYQKPNTVSVIWSPDILTMTGKPPTRGFGGRVFFYNERTQAVPVDGELIVHGYRGDPMLGESEQVQADKTFRFTAEQLTGHFSPSELGASYSVWIPWDAADGFREEVTLIPTFKGLDGLVVQGAPAKLFLPGRSLEAAANKDAASQTSPYAFETQTVSYQQRSIPTNTTGTLPQMERQTVPTTIELPALGSLGRPRAHTAATPGLGFVLGASAPGNSQLPNANSGYSLNNAATAPLPTVPSALQLPSASTPGATSGSLLPSASTPTMPAAPLSPASIQAPTLSPAVVPFANLRASITPSQPNFGEQASKPFAHQPWHMQQ